ncbi:WhiB family transcriptional regulator [Streptomyces nitrosporeus]|uniref:Transcriptional regulator WhiB n=1 Tax=Streptomyces nitrosporeus TaxID=28894 RepID=A0A5J6FMF1_9ACTN|nr:WhiB family transcriptional regulator [Streptomyces nitrosporeus]
MLSMCREDPDLFFPVGTTGPALAQAEEAKAVCRRCPVMEQCLQWVLAEGPQAGIWAATDEAERTKLRRRTRRTAQARHAPQTAQTRVRQLLDTHTVDLGDGHRGWRGGPVRIDGVVHSGKQVAWVAAHGVRPAAPLLGTCHRAGCVVAAHQRLRTDPASCGTRPGYQGHLARGEDPCTPCRQANTDADRRLRNTGTAA